MVEAHFARVAPVVGQHLRRAQVAVVGLPQATPLVTHLAACGVGRWVWEVAAPPLNPPRWGGEPVLPPWEELEGGTPLRAQQPPLIPPAGGESRSSPQRGELEGGDILLHALRPRCERSTAQR